MNDLLGRWMIEYGSDDYVINKIKTFLNRTLNDKKPSAIKKFEVLEFHWGLKNPIIDDIHIHPTLLNGELCYSADLQKEDGPKIKLGIDIDINNKITTFQKYVIIEIQVDKIDGKIVLYIPPPFIDKGYGYLSFIYHPNIDISLDTNLDKISNKKYVKTIIERFVLWSAKSVFFIIYK